jgi:hypothetical protein
LHLLSSFEGSSIIREDCNSHANETSEHGSEGTKKESNCGPEVSKLFFDSEEDDEGHKDREDKNILIFFEEEGVCASFNMRSDLLEEVDVVLSEDFAKLVIDILSVGIVLNPNGSDFDSIDDCV